MLVLKNVVKKYRTKAGEVNALDGVSLTLPATGLVFIAGKSGSGKTTLLNVIGGLDGIDGGEIFVQDKRLSSFSAEEYDNYRNTFIGFVFQEYNLLSEYSVEYNIKIAMELQGDETSEENFQRLLKDMEIEDLKDRKPSELSGGQRQRVAIARALLKQPRVIMADEPTGALDSATGAQVLDTLKRLSKDKLIIIVSHDQEFAEKYADRIIRLVDGKVAEDITFADRELPENVTERGDTLVVRQGIELSATEKDVLAKAVKERKTIEFTEKLSFREKVKTEETESVCDEPLVLKRSKMKRKSCTSLGLKSLVVKPIRLAITILISALAFAVFGLFDTIANFSAKSVLQNHVNQTSSTVVTYGNYVVDWNADDRYAVRLSQEVVDGLQTRTGGTVKGIYDFYGNNIGSWTQSSPIAELASSTVVVGRKYYANEVNGFIEFSATDEMTEEGKFNDFDYELVLGKYPQLTYDEDGALVEESLHQAAISTYLADSILYYLNGESLNETVVNGYEELLGAKISVGQRQYTIVGLIDCGAIPEKYESIKSANPYSVQLASLMQEYTSYINSDARKCLFVAEGYRQAVNEQEARATVFYTGNIDWGLRTESTTVKRTIAGYVYDADDHKSENVLFFNGKTPADGKITLADEEVLVHHKNLESLFAAEINALGDTTKINNARRLIQNAQSDRGTLYELLKTLKKDLSSGVDATITIRSTKTAQTDTKTVKIVGAYFGVDTNSYTTASTYKMMMNKTLMSTLGIYEGQGEYAKILFSPRSVRSGGTVLADYLTAEKGLSLVWYNNTALNQIRENETMIRQAAELFLYAALALAVFSIFMLYNYISTSIANKRHSVGVLRGLGAGSKDVLRIFLSESLIIGVINGVLACGLSALGCMLVNHYIKTTMNLAVSFALFGIRQVLMIAGISLLTAIVSSVLPIIKISQKKPVELIRNS